MRGRNNVALTAICGFLSRTDLKPFVVNYHSKSRGGVLTHPVAYYDTCC